MAIASQQYNVGGILLARPFKVRRLGHFGFNALKMAEGLHFYNALLGFKISDELDFAKVPGKSKRSMLVAFSCVTARITTRL